MTPQVYQFILGVGGFIIVILLGIVGYFLKRNLKAISNLNITVYELNTTLSIQELSLRNITERFKEKYEVIEKKIDNMDNRLCIVEHNLTIVQTKLIK